MGSLKDQFHAIAMDAQLKHINIGPEALRAVLDVRSPLDVLHYFVTLPARLDAYEAKLQHLLADDLPAHGGPLQGPAPEVPEVGIAEAPLHVALVWQACEDPDLGANALRAAVGVVTGQWLGGEQERLWGVQVARTLLQSHLVVEQPIRVAMRTQPTVRHNFGAAPSCMLDVHLSVRNCLTAAAAVSIHVDSGTGAGPMGGGQGNGADVAVGGQRGAVGVGRLVQWVGLT